MTSRMSPSVLDQDSFADGRSTRRGDAVSYNLVNATQERILRGAIAALGRHGSQSLSMSDVALASNVSRATLYRYFPTKVTVLESVSEYISSTFLHGAEAILRNVDDPLQRLRAVMALQLELATQGSRPDKPAGTATPCCTRYRPVFYPGPGIGQTMRVGLAQNSTMKSL